MKDVVYHGQVYRVTDDTLPEFCFRPLSDSEEREFIAWAKAQPEGVKVKGLWHPVVQNELLLSGRGAEHDE